MCKIRGLLRPHLYQLKHGTFNTVDFVGSQIDRVALAPYTRATTTMYVDRIGNKVDHDKLSNSSCCRFVAKTGDKVDRIGDSRLGCRFVTGFDHSRLCALDLRLQHSVTFVLSAIYKYSYLLT